MNGMNMPEVDVVATIKLMIGIFADASDVAQKEIMNGMVVYVNDAEPQDIIGIM